ncbi:MAG: TIGR03013 family PEP-CTERM/XrtA system glycosyltransferase, partial [Alphaproteobacteria bacterium]|nr:TIGR03013 family PEP-CTERM/XrtA system glycosyltransferase [Alphaproteobacteria bacterium]
APQNGGYLLCRMVLATFIPRIMVVGWALVNYIDQTGSLTRRVLVLGSGPLAVKIEGLCNRHRDRSLTVAGYVHLGTPPETTHGTESRRVPNRRNDYWLPPEHLPAFCLEHDIDELVVATKERRGLPMRDLLACKLAGISINEFSSFWERECRQIDLDEVSPSWLGFSDGFQVGRVRSFIKRLFDIVVSALLLTLSLPITLLTAFLIKLESPGQVFYRQERVGLGGKPYNILKFRSMRADAEKDGPRWASRNDSRVTKVGAIIRKLRIDEIPQVINVLKGEMAFVGPRPERPVFVAALSDKIPYYNERHIIKPGITGWAQINYPYGATEEDAKMKLSYDLYYAKNGDIFMDILIIIQTVKVLLWNSGAR